MTKEVIKKGGKIQAFNLNKIKRSLISALQKTNLSKEKQDEIFKDVLKDVLDFLKGKETVFSSEIEAEIILKLEKICPEAVSFWRDYRVKKKK